jgi:apolipoprotein N-acyltransferase
MVLRAGIGSVKADCDSLVSAPRRLPGTVSAVTLRTLSSARVHSEPPGLRWTSRLRVRCFIKAAIALVCGCLLVLSGTPFDFWPLAWIASAPLIWIALDEKTTHAWAYGWLFGLAVNAGGLYWFFPYLERFAHLPAIVALLVFFLLISYQAVTWALFCHFLRRLRRDAGMPVTFLAPIVFVAVEAVVPYVFDWYLALTQAWVIPIIQIAELTGPLGVSFLIMLCNAMLYDVVAARRRGAAWPRGAVLAAAAVLIACTAFGFARIHYVRSAREAAPKFTVGVVQANVGIVRKRRAEDAHNRLTQHQELSAALQQAGADVILWSETSYPYTFRREQSRDWSPGHPRRARQGFDRPLVFGALTASSGSPLAYNSAMLLDEHDRVRGRFDKNILIAFGEYIPFYEQLPVIRRWLPAANNLARGTDVALLSFESKAGVVNIAPMICYEDIIPSFGRRIARLRPNLLVNLTNDAWFGDTSLPWLHLASSVFRAVEMRLDLVRAANTGVSAFVDSTGRVYAKTRSVDPDDTPDVLPDTLLESVAIQQAQTVYATLGEWFGGGGILAAFVLYLRMRRREGTAVRWDLVAAGALTLAGVIVLVTIVTGPARLGAVITALARIPSDAALPADEAAVVWRLLVGTLLGSAALGFVIARGAAKQPRDAECTLAVVAVLVCPALAVGTLEGQQAGLVIGALLGAGLARLGARLTRGA